MTISRKVAKAAKENPGLSINSSHLQLSCP